jgi:hypothetical protein
MTDVEGWAEALRARDAAWERIANLEAALKSINMVCAHAPPCDELDEDGETYNSIIDSIQGHVRWAFETSGKQE